MQDSERKDANELKRRCFRMFCQGWNAICGPLPALSATFQELVTDVRSSRATDTPTNQSFRASRERGETADAESEKG